MEVWETKKVSFITSFLWSPLYNKIVPLIALSFLLYYHSLDMLEWASFRLVFMSLWYHINVLSSESLESSFLLGWFWHQCVTYLIGLYGNKLGWVGLLHSYVLHIYPFDVERNKHTGSGSGHNIWQKEKKEFHFRKFLFYSNYFKCKPHFLNPRRKFSPRDTIDWLHTTQS